MKIALALLLGGVAATCYGDVVFTATIVPDPGFSNTTGNITVQISLPTLCAVNGTCAADSVVITSEPSVMTAAEGNTPSTWTYQVANSFTVQSGQLTSASFFAVSDLNPSPASLFCINSTINIYSTPEFVDCFGYSVYLDTPTNYEGEHTGFDGITFPNLNQTPPAVPEPSTMALFGAGALIVVLKRKAPQR